MPSYSLRRTGGGSSQIQESWLDTRSSSNQDLKVSPNPVTNKIQIDFSMQKVKSCIIYNAEGIVMHNQIAPRSNELNLDLPPGVYHLILNKYDGGTESARFVVIN